MVQNQALSDNLKFKLGFHKYFDVAMIASVLLHLLGFLVSPDYAPVAYTPDVEEIVVIPEAEEVTVPLPPVALARPSIPIAAEFCEVEVSDEADPEETILDTDVDLDNPVAARLNYVDPALGEAEFLSYSVKAMPKKIHKPDYPELAEQAGIEGTVVASIYIDEKGFVIRVEILQTPSDVFIEPVKKAVFASTYYPAMQRDIAVKCKMTQTFEFKSGQ